jgi:hypothetical protein
MTSGPTKQCWSCDATTPYDVGWCEECFAKIPLSLREAISFEEPWGGRVRMALADTIRAMRYGASRPARTYTPKPPKEKPSISLDDLDDFDI